MENKIVELAVFYPHGCPWKRSNLDISIEELNSILKDKGLNDHILRRKAGYELDIISYLEAARAKDYEDLKKRVLTKLKGRKYISEDLVEKELSRKYLTNTNERKVYTKFINNNMTIDDKNTFIKSVQLWLVDLFYYYKCSFDSNTKSDDIKEVILKIMGHNYTESKFNPNFVNELRKRRAFERQNILEIVYAVSKDFKSELGELLNKYVPKSNNETCELSFEDELFDIINDTSELESDCKLGDEQSKEHNDEVKNVLEIKNVVEVKDYNEIKENQTEIHLKGLANSLGYKLIKLEQDFEEDSEIGLLKDLASYKKGAVLSELYNAYVNFDNITKDNLEAIINNFFTSLKLQGFEVDDTNVIGDEISLDTKDLLSDFILTSPISKKGIIKGKIKYLPWIYKGKKVMPMVIKPLDK